MSSPLRGISVSRRPRGSRVVAVLLTLLLLAAAGFGVRRLLTETQTPARRAACPTALASPPPPAPQQVHLRVLNATTRRGLAKQVATELTARGFVVDQIANAASPQPGPATVLFGTAAQPASAVVAAFILGATTAPGPPTAAPGSLDLVLGGAYQRLRTPPEIAALPPAVPAGRPRPGC